MLLQPPTQEIRPFSRGRSSVQDGEKISIVDRALSTASFWELIIMKSISMNAQPEYIGNNTNLGVCDVIEHDAQGASRILSEARVAEAHLLDQESIVTEDVGGILRVHERGDRVSLGIVVVRSRNGLVQRWDARTEFPMTRTGILSCLSWLGLGEGSFSTERTGHPYEEYLRLGSECNLRKSILFHVPKAPDSSDLIRDVLVRRINMGE